MNWIKLFSSLYSSSDELEGLVVLEIEKQAQSGQMSKVYFIIESILIVTFLRVPNKWLNSGGFSIIF